LTLWKEVVDGISSSLISSSEFQLMYWDLGLSSQQELGTCVELDVFLNDHLPTTLISYSPVSMTLFWLGAEEMMSIHDLSDSLELSKAIQDHTCDEPEVVDALLRDWRSFGSLDYQMRSHYPCDGSDWSVLKCTSTSTSGIGVSMVILCVNCPDNFCEMNSTQQSLYSRQAISCSDPPIDPFGHLSILSLEFEALLPPPSLLQKEILSIADSTVSLRAMMSDSGYLICSAYSVSSAPHSSEELLFQNIPVSGVIHPHRQTSSSTAVLYEIIDLSASTAYDIYCTTLSPHLIALPTIWMLRSKISIRTLCCRKLIVHLNQLIVDDVSVVSSALTFR
jgi:hypothetical protein